MSEKAKSKGRPAGEFFEAHDKNVIVPKKIEAAIKALGEGWDYEIGFLKLSGLSTTDLAMFREKYADFIVETPGRNPKRVWCGTKKLALDFKARV